MDFDFSIIFNTFDTEVDRPDFHEAGGVIKKIISEALGEELNHDKELPSFGEGLKKLSKSDLLVVCTTEESGEYVIALRVVR